MRERSNIPGHGHIVGHSTIVHLTAEISISCEDDRFCRGIFVPHFASVGDTGLAFAKWEHNSVPRQESSSAIEMDCGNE